MGLLDVLDGMQNGSRGYRGGLGGSGGGMSPITMALLGLLAYKAVKGFSGMQTGAAPQPVPSVTAGAAPPNGGGIGDWLKNSLGGLLAGGNAGPLLSGGLGDLLKQFQQAGHGDVANSWVDTGANKAVTPEMLEKVLTSEQIAMLTTQTGLQRDQLLTGISQQLPDVVDHLTPAGRMPTSDEMASRI